jgi:hypothetical protein
MTVVIAVLLVDVIGSWMTRRVLTRCGEAGNPSMISASHTAEAAR